MMCVLIDEDDGSNMGLPLFSLTRKVSFGLSDKRTLAWSTVISHIELENDARFSGVVPYNKAQKLQRNTY